MSSSRRYTTRCNLCHAEFVTEFAGPFQSLAYYVSIAKFFWHLITKHREQVTIKAVIGYSKVFLLGVVALVIVLLKCVAYIFYPIYALLGWFYD